jgi:serine/threonine protein phosphatase PrpC
MATDDQAFTRDQFTSPSEQIVPADDPAPRAELSAESTAGAGDATDHSAPAVYRAGPWQAVSATALGGTHRISGKPNQDAHSVTAVDDALVLVVADGHGSEKSFRSDRGSRMATGLGASLAADVLPLLGSAPADDLTTLVRDRVAEMVDRWQWAVREDEGVDRLVPGSIDEWPVFATDADLLRVYGSTFVFALLTDRHGLFVQIGDGDLTARSVTGDTGPAVEGDARLFANQTTSLCQVDADRDIRIRIVDLDRVHLELVMLSSDGYGNAFEDEIWQPAVAADVVELRRTEGLDWIADNLSDWADDAAMTAGDDVTIVLAFRDGSTGGTDTEGQVGGG